MKTPGTWAGKTVRDVNVRSAHQGNIIGVKRGQMILPMTDPDYVFQLEEHLVMAGGKEDLLKIADMD